MNILLRFEGGLGDHLLANRFVFAIKDKYPDDNLICALEDQKKIDVLKELWPSTYKTCILLSERSTEPYIVKSKFYTFNDYTNVHLLGEPFPDLMKKCDRYYDLHIDRLCWLHHDYDWVRYYDFFPKPERKTQSIEKFGLKDEGEDFVMMHLYARPEALTNLDLDYALKLIESVSKNHKVVLISEKPYSDTMFRGKCNATVIDNASFTELFDIASRCKCFVGIDSSIRFIPLHFGKPSFVMSKHYDVEKGQDRLANSHTIRWLVFKKYILPYNERIERISTIVDNIYENDLYKLIPTDIKNIDFAFLKHLDDHNYIHIEK